MVPVRYPAEIPLPPALIVPYAAVEIEIELCAPWPIVVPWFCTRMPALLAPELIVTPKPVVMFTEPRVESAKIPFNVAPVTVVPLPTDTLSAPAPLVCAKMPRELPDTLP